MGANRDRSIGIGGRNTAGSGPRAQLLQGLGVTGRRKRTGRWARPAHLAERVSRSGTGPSPAGHPPADVAYVK